MKLILFKSFFPFGYFQPVLRIKRPFTDSWLTVFIDKDFKGFALPDVEVRWKNLMS